MDKLCFIFLVKNIQKCNLKQRAFFNTGCTAYIARLPLSVWYAAHLWRDTEKNNSLVVVRIWGPDRVFPTGLRSTLCLPFSLSVSCIPDIFPQLYLQAVLVSADLSPGFILLLFSFSARVSGHQGLFWFFVAHGALWHTWHHLNSVLSGSTRTQTFTQNICHSCFATAS